MNRGDRVKWTTTAGDTWTGTIDRIRRTTADLRDIRDANGNTHGTGRAPINVNRLRPR